MLFVVFLCVALTLMSMLFGMLIIQTIDHHTTFGVLSFRHKVSYVVAVLWISLLIITISSKFQAIEPTVTVTDTETTVTVPVEEPKAIKAPKTFITLWLVEGIGRFKPTGVKVANIETISDGIGKNSVNTIRISGIEYSVYETSEQIGDLINGK